MSLLSETKSFLSKNFEMKDVGKRLSYIDILKSYSKCHNVVIRGLH